MKEQVTAIVYSSPTGSGTGLPSRWLQTPGQRSTERGGERLEEMGIPRWAERARDEACRVGRQPTASTLTETERRVAELVASGRSNQETAAELFMSVKTVEANLTRIYRKLSVRSRTELANRINNLDSAPRRD